MIIDLFRGPGGWSQGLRTLGITDEHGIDNDPAAHATATAAGHKGELADITTLDPRDYTGENIAGEIASPPCPGFSMAGKGEGRKDLALILAAAADLNRGIDPATVFGMLRAWQNDERSALTLEPLHWALTLRPSWIALEQVPAVLPIWEAYAAALSAHGYNTWTGKVHAEQYGVPQTRTRAVMLASLNRQVGQPEPTHSKYHGREPSRLDAGRSPWITMADALGWTQGETGVRWVCERPATTVQGDPRLGRPGHKHRGPGCCTANTAAGARESQFEEGSVRITLREAAELQTFPADYPWQGGLGQTFQQVGNAVPPLLAAHLLAELGVGQLPATNQLIATA